MTRSLFHRETTVKGNTEEFVRSSIQAEFPDLKLPMTKRLELYTVLAVETDLSTGAIFEPEHFLVCLLDVGWPAIPARYMVANDPSQKQVFSVPDRDDQRIIYPDSPGRLLIGPKPGIPESEVRAALAPFIESVLYYSPTLVEVAVKPFHEKAIADGIEREIPEVVKYAETNFIVRRVYSPGWFAMKLL